MVIDEKQLVIGSYNISDKSAELDDECVLVIKSAELAKKTSRVLEEDRQASVKLDENYTPSLTDTILGSISNAILGRVMQ